MKRYIVYRETGSFCSGTLQIHKANVATLHKAKAEAVRQQQEHGGYVTIMRNGIEVYEVAP